MFRKLVSNLAFSPALVGQLGFYAKRLRKEEATRRIGVMFTVFALIVQYLAVFQAPQPANAANSNDLIYGGIDASNDSQRKAKLLANYDGNTNNIRDLFETIGITRAELESAANGGTQWLKSTLSGAYSWGMQPHFSAAQGEGSYTVKASQGGTRTFYYRPHHLWGNYNYRAFVGNSSKVGWFAIMFVCGNLVMRSVPPAPACPPGQVGTYPNCSTPPAPAATCNALSVNKNGNSYQLAANASAANGATISQYVFSIYKNNSLVKTITSTTPNATYQQKEPGSYKVTLTVKTSIGDKTSASCEKTFVIPEPERCPQNPNLLKDDPKCQPCPGDETLWIDADTCKAEFVQTKSATNTTQGNVNASTATARASDKIIYKINVTNRGNKPSEYSISENLADVLEYATVEDAGGATLATDSSGSTNTKTLLTWPKITIQPNETQTRVFSVKLLDTIPSRATGVSNPVSYDCRMTNTFGNTVDISVDCPVQKQAVEQTVAELPHTGPGENMLFAGGLLAVVSFFYARSRQLKKEVRLIRRDFNAGTI